MLKTIRKTYPRDFSIGILLIIFALLFFLSGGIFEKTQFNVDDSTKIYLGGFLVSLASLIMILIMWEEILFTVKIKPTDHGLIFRNHPNKLRIQVLLYLSIPVVIVFLYMNYDVIPFRFFPWAAVCIILPVAGKLISGINNYNDFLTLTTTRIEYKNNEKEGAFELQDIDCIQLIEDETGLLVKLRLELKTDNEVIIDLDEMELDAYYDAIEEYINSNFKSLLKVNPTKE